MLFCKPRCRSVGSTAAIEPIIDHSTAADIMTKNPKTVNADQLAVDALDLMRKHDITQLVVKRGDEYMGILHLHDLIREGLI